MWPGGFRPPGDSCLEFPYGPLDTGLPVECAQRRREGLAEREHGREEVAVTVDARAHLVHGKSGRVEIGP